MCLLFKFFFQLVQSQSQSYLKLYRWKEILLNNRENFYPKTLSEVLHFISSQNFYFNSEKKIVFIKHRVHVYFLFRCHSLVFVLFSLS